MEQVFSRMRAITSFSDIELPEFVSLDNVTVNAYYAVPQKTGKMEYDFQSSQQETCVSALLPHMGYTPCWYLRRQTDKQIQL